MSGTAFSIVAAGRFAEPAPALGSTPPSEGAFYITVESTRTRYEPGVFATMYTTLTMVPVNYAGDIGDIAWSWEAILVDPEITVESIEGPVIQLSSTIESELPELLAEYLVTATDSSEAAATAQPSIEFEWDLI